VPVYQSALFHPEWQVDLAYFLISSMLVQIGRKPL